MSVRDLLESAMNRQATRFQDTLRVVLAEKVEAIVAAKAVDLSAAYSRPNIHELTGKGSIRRLADRVEKPKGDYSAEDEPRKSKFGQAYYLKKADDQERGSASRKRSLRLASGFRNYKSRGHFPTTHKEEVSVSEGHWSWNPPKKSGPRAWNRDIKSKSSLSSGSGGERGDTSNKVHSVRPIHRFVVDREHDNPRLRSRNMAMVHSRIDGKWHLHRDKPTGLHDVGQAGWYNHEDGIKWARASWKSGHNHHVFEDDTSAVVSEVSNNWVTKKLDGAYDKVKGRNPYTDRKADAVIGRIRAIHGYRHAMKGSDKAKQNKGFARSARAAYRD